MSSGLTVRAVVEQGDFRLDVEFAAAPGEVVAVLGPNGAGKSTLLRAIAGLAALNEGQIALDDQPFDDVAAGVFRAANRRPVGLVFQDYRLFPHLSVLENVAFGPRSNGVHRRTAHHLAADWLRRFGLTEYADRKPLALSGGQAQRVALARALAGQPALLLLDEPLAALDARTRLEVRAELRRHLAEFAGPTLLVTHDPLDAMVLADRLLVIEEGRIVQTGTPGAVARRPQTHYVAQLVGLNLYRGVQTGTRVALTGGGTLQVTAEASRPEPRTDDEPGRPVLIAVRPSTISLHTTRPAGASPRNLWAGRVDGLESLTDRVRVHVAATPSAIVDVTTDAVADLHIVDGADVWLSAKATDLDVYADPRD